MHGRRRTGCEELQVKAVLTVDCKSAALLLEEPGATAARLLRAWSARQQSAGDLPQYRQIVVHGAGGIQGEPVRGPRAPHRTVAARAPTAPWTPPAPRPSQPQSGKGPEWPAPLRRYQRVQIRYRSCTTQHVIRWHSPPPIGTSARRGGHPPRSTQFVNYRNEVRRVSRAAQERDRLHVSIPEGGSSPTRSSHREVHRNVLAPGSAISPSSEGWNRSCWRIRSRTTPARDRGTGRARIARPPGRSCTIGEVPMTASSRTQGVPVSTPDRASSSLDEPRGPAAYTTAVSPQMSSR